MKSRFFFAIMPLVMVFILVVPGIAAAQSTLPDSVVAAMRTGIQDEYNAYATYGAVIGQLGAVKPFVSIQKAEAQHITAWKTVFTKYGVPVPSAPGSVNVPKFATVAEACKAGVVAEKANIVLYDRMLTAVKSYPELVKVVTALRTASVTSHLPAFERCAK